MVAGARDQVGVQPVGSLVGEHECAGRDPALAGSALLTAEGSVLINGMITVYHRLEDSPPTAGHLARAKTQMRTATVIWQQQPTPLPADGFVSEAPGPWFRAPENRSSPMPNNNQVGVIAALAAAFVCCIGYLHPSLVPAIGLAIGVWVALYAYLKQ